MSILETFYILFKSNASDFKKDAKDVDKATNEMAETFKTAEQQTRSFDEGLLNLGKSVVNFAASAISAAAIFSAFRASIGHLAELQKASYLIGVNIEDLDAWGEALKTNGGTLEGFESSLQSLASKLGTSPRIALKLLPQLADAFHRLGRFRSLRYGRDVLGLDPATILLLQKGRKEVQAIIDQQKALGVVTEKDAKNYQEFNKELVQTEHAFRSLFVSLGAEYLPLLTKALNAVTGATLYLRRHKDLIIGFMTAVGGYVTGLTLRFIALNAAIFLPIVGFLALAAAVAIAYDDIQAFIKGNDSLTGRILKNYPLIGSAVKELISIFDDLVKVLELVKFGFDLLQDVVDFGRGKNSVNINAGKALLMQAGRNPITAQTSNSIFGQNAYSKENNVNIDNISIVTQATDAPGIGTALGNELQRALWHANSQFDNGVLR